MIKWISNRFWKRRTIVLVSEMVGMFGFFIGYVVGFLPMWTIFTYAGEIIAEYIPNHILIIIWICTCSVTLFCCTVLMIHLERKTKQKLEKLLSRRESLMKMRE